MRDEVIQWFDKEKGINTAVLELVGISESSEGDILFPYGEGVYKSRSGVPDGRRHFSFTAGASLLPFNSGDAVRPTVFICEGETDTLRLKQEYLDNPDIGVVGLPGVTSWKSDWRKYFADAKSIYVVLDNDDDYSVRATVDKAWSKIRVDLPKARRIRLPSGTKDICEFFKSYSFDDWSTLINRRHSLRYNALDLLNPPPPPDWVVDKLIAKGDIVLLIGEPGAGKSWLTMDLAIKLVNNQPTWLGHRLANIERARILYIDEENPVDVIYTRLSKLGLKPSKMPFIRYLHNEGIRLDSAGDEILEEALAFQPDLIVIDSLTRVHTIDENSAGAMAKLFNDSLKPLARSTGAATILLHHAGKGDGSGYKRARGSGDITASVDTAIDCRALQPGVLGAHVYKSRRGLIEDPIIMQIHDYDDTTTVIREVAELSPMI